MNEKEGMFGKKDVKIKDKKDNELNVYCYRQLLKEVDRLNTTPAVSRCNSTLTFKV